MNNLYIGIDPGKSGALVALDATGAQQHKTVVQLIGKEYDELATKSLLEGLRPYTIHAVLESVHAIQGNAGATSNFTFGQGEMLWRMGLVCLEFSFTRVLPKTWQKEMWQGVPEQRKPGKKNKKGVLVRGRVDTKAMSLIAAKRLFPTLDLRASERCKVPHDGIVDALLMAEYCRRKFA